VPASRFDAAVRWIAAHARLLGDAPRRTFHFPSWNADAVYFEDPAGNVVELIARHALHIGRRHDAEDEFHAREIVSVSEVGLPVTAVERTARFLAEATDTPLWGRSTPAFTALGDDHGLFILVANARSWYPTARPAQMHPLLLTIAGARERRLGIPGSPYLVVVRRPR
jgi:catechol-2,3-dioxygenase